MHKSSGFSSLRRAGVLAATLVLAGCGGGDGEEAVTPAVPLAAAFGHFVSDAVTSQVTYAGTATGPGGQQLAVSGSASVVEVTTAATFNGMPALRKDITETGQFVIQGASYPVAATSTTYFSAQFVPLGSQSDNGYCVVSDHQPLPVTARAGHSSAWYKTTCYTNASKTVQIGSATASWAVEADTATSLRFKLISRLTDASSAVLESTQTLRVTTDGTVQRLADTGTASQGDVRLQLTITYQ